MVWVVDSLEHGRSPCVYRGMLFRHMVWLMPTQCLEHPYFYLALLTEALPEPNVVSNASRLLPCPLDTALASALLSV
jgi:hypothetical protein